jgi:hypothetical protein
MAERDSQAEGDRLEEFSLPVVPEQVAADPLLLALIHCAAFLDFAEEDVVDPYVATDVLDHVALYVRRLPPDRIADLEQQLARLEAHASSEGWPAELVEFVSEFLDNCQSDESDDDTDIDLPPA